MAETSFGHPALRRSAEPVAPTAAMAISGIPTELQTELAGKIIKASSEWVAQIGQMQRYESDFAADLAHCRYPSEAVALCSKWLAHRVDSAVSMQHRMIELWLDAVTAEAERKLTARTGSEPDEEHSHAR